MTHLLMVGTAKHLLQIGQFAEDPHQQAEGGALTSSQLPHCLLPAPQCSAERQQLVWLTIVRRVFFFIEYLYALITPHWKVLQG